MILIGCEESQVVTKALRNANFVAYSCDLKETRGNPEWHYKKDIMDVIRSRIWDMIILHPDCTAMSVSGNRWYGKNMKYNNKRKSQIEWTLKLWELAKKYTNKLALENPVSVIFPFLSNVFYLQPWQHGHGETKKTGFALHGLSPLKPTKIVSGRKNRIWKMSENKNRKRERSITYQGIADAIVEQWAN